MRLNHYLKESSLARLWSHMQEHDTGTITAWRKHEYDEDGNIVKTYTRKENSARNRELQAFLLRLGTVTKVRGAYIVNYKTPKEHEVGDNVFFVVDSNDKGSLEKKLRKLGTDYNQDSVLFIPKGGTIGNLWGTKKDEYSNKFSYPGYGKKMSLPKAVWGKEGEFMTKISGRPFLFTEDMRELPIPKGFFTNYGLWAVTREKDWRRFL